MKLVRTLLIVGLALSMILNYFQYLKNERLRPQLVVNGHRFTMRDYHDWLEQHFGLQTQAAMIKYYLVTDAAKKAGVMPTDAEVKQAVKDQEEANPQLVARMTSEPWLRKDLEQGEELQLAMLNLTTNGTKLTDDQARSTYETFGASAFDVPAKVHVVMIGSADKDPARRAEYVKRAKDLVDSMAARARLEEPAPGVRQKLLPDINMVLQQLTPHVGYLIQMPGGRQVFRSTQPDYAAVNGLNVGDSKILPGGQALIYVEKREEGRKSSLSDPVTRRKVEQQYKLMTGGGKLIDQKLRELWDASTIKTDPESQKVDIEHILFSNQPAGKPAQ
jgi:hypothetical protein